MHAHTPPRPFSRRPSSAPHSRRRSAACGSVARTYERSASCARPIHRRDANLGAPASKRKHIDRADPCADSMMAFHRAEQAILLCTDVAARGLDFPAVTHIVQYDPPGEVAEYVQRVGRSARMGKRGTLLLSLCCHGCENPGSVDGDRQANTPWPTKLDTEPAWSQEPVQAHLWLQMFLAAHPALSLPCLHGPCLEDRQCCRSLSCEQRTPTGT